MELLKKDAKNFEDFRMITKKISDHAKSIGIDIAPYRSPELLHFSKLTKHDQERAVRDAAQYLDICDQTVAQGASLASPVLVWKALKALQFIPPSNLFEHYKDGDVVEIHALDGRQIFSNFNFYSCCSYSLEELYSYPWNEIYKHDGGATAQIVDFANSVVTGKLKQMALLDIPNHLITEVYSPFRYVIDAKVRAGGPLFDKGRVPVATIVFETGKVISGHTTKVEQEKRLTELANLSSPSI